MISTSDVKLYFYYFIASEWSNISFEAIDLIRKLLTFDDELRLPSIQALESPWIQGFHKDGIRDNLLDPNMVKNLTVFTVNIHPNYILYT